MSDKTVVDILKKQHKTLDESVHSLVRVVADIKGIVLDNRERLDQHGVILERHEVKLNALDKGLNALAEATLAGFKRLDEEQAATRSDIAVLRSDVGSLQSDVGSLRGDVAGLELLIRQRLPEN